MGGGGANNNNNSGKNQKNKNKNKPYLLDVVDMSNQRHSSSKSKKKKNSTTEKDDDDDLFVSTKGSHGGFWHTLLHFLGWRDAAWLVVTLAVYVGSRNIHHHTTTQQDQRELINVDSAAAAATDCRVVTEENHPSFSWDGGSDSVITTTRRRISPNCFPLPVLDIHSMTNALSPRACRDLIRAAESNHGGWTGMSAFGGYQGTRDVSLSTLMDQGLLEESTFHELDHLIGEKLSKLITKEYVTKLPNLDGKIGSAKSQKQYENYNSEQVVRLKGTPFIIQYRDEDINQVRLHKDNSDVSFVVLLSNPGPDGGDFDGGGTEFQVINTTIHLQQGEALIFNGQLVHGAKPVTRGTRYVLSGFTNFDEQYKKMKRLSTLATTVNLD